MQVLNEFAAVARRKLHRHWQDIGKALEVIRWLCPDPVPLTLEIHERGRAIARETAYSVFDSLAIAAAVQAGSQVLYSEDMRDGQKLRGLTIRNPFATPGRPPVRPERPPRKH